jgi:WD40 repeat protein
MASLDRRDFFGVALPLVVGAVSLDAASPPPVPAPPKIGDALKPVKSEEVLKLPAEASARLGDPKLRLPGYVNAVQFSPKGTTLVGASSEEIRAWDPRTGKVKFRIGYPDQASVDAGRLTNRDTFALLVRPNTGGAFEIRHYEFGTGRLISISKPMTLGQAQHTAFSIDGALMACVRQEGIALHDAATGAEKWRETLSPEAVGGCQFFPDASTIALATNGEVKLFSVATGKLKASLKVVESTAGGPRGGGVGNHGKDWLQNLVISPDGTSLAVALGEEGDAVCCWDVKSGKVVHTFKPAAKPIAFSPDGKELLTYQAGVATWWTLSNGEAKRFDVPNDDDLTLSPDGSMLASATGDSATLMDPRTGKHLPHSSDPPGLPATLVFTDRSRLLGRLDGFAGWIEFDLANKSRRFIRPPDVNGQSPVALAVDQSTAAYHKDTEFSLRTVRSGKVEAKLVSDHPARQGFGATLSSDGKHLIGWAAQTLIAEPIGGGKKRTISRVGVTGSVSTIAVSRDGRIAAVALNNNDTKCGIEVFDLTTDKFERHLVADGDIGQVEITPDGNWLAAAHAIANEANRFGQQGTASVFDLHSGKAVLKLPADDNREHQIALSPNGRLLARAQTENASGDKAEYKIVLWEVLGGNIRKKLDVGGTITALAFSPDSRTLAASVQGAPIFLWDLYGGTRPPAVTGAAMNQTWTDLSSSNAETAFGAMRSLGTCAEAVPFLRKQIPPVSPPDEKRVRGLIADLDHKDYRRREVASKELAALGERVRGTLRKELAGTLPTETRERIEKLLVDEEKPSAELLRMLRALEVLEAIGTKEAAEVMAYWSTGAPGARFTREAEAAKRRFAGVP